MRVILYTGKGGAGKTSAAGATAFWAARMGHRGSGTPAGSEAQRTWSGKGKGCKIRVE